MKILVKFSLLILFLLGSLGLSLAQQTTVTGTVQDKLSDQSLARVSVTLEGRSLSVKTDEKGTFALSFEGDYTGWISFELGGYTEQREQIQVLTGESLDLGTIKLESLEDEEMLGADDLVPVVNLGDAETDLLEGSDISGLLTASRDVFVSTASFNFGPRRFRIRGYDSEHTNMFLNGVPINDPESGRIYWTAWAGLNDVTRNRETHVGLRHIGFDFGGFGGATSIDTRASSQRKQTRFSYSVSNRSYRQRLMGTWSSGWLKDDWAISVSGSRRWAQEGFIPGTFYDSWSYFLSVDKKLNEKHLLNLNVLGVSISRGRPSAHVLEMYELANDNFYNSNWGYQEGEKRNARVAHQHQPFFMLQHDWEPTRDWEITTSATYQFGPNGSTAMSWLNARDPRPDYYRYLPSFVEDPEAAAQVEQKYRNDVSVRQLDWSYFYSVNQNAFTEIENANGIPGNTVSGNLSRYIVEDRRYDFQRFMYRTHLFHSLSKVVNLTGAVTYEWYKGEDFKVVDDLLGGEFFVDWDNFAQRDFPNDIDAIQNDLDNPNRILDAGDEFGYKYESHIRKWNTWGQAEIVLSKFDFHVGASVSGTTFWRDGKNRKGLFPENSLGESEKKEFTNFGLKGGAVWKIDGRNYIYADGMYQTRAPYFRNSFVSPRTRNQLAPNLESETNYGVEGGYYLQAPYIKGRLTGYYSRFEDQTRVRSFFHDDEQSFVNFIMQDIDLQHAGIEFALEADITTTLSVEAVAAIGQYLYKSRPTATIAQDNNAALLATDRTIYANNFYVGGRPQSAYTLGFDYNGKDFWFVTVNLSYFDDLYIDFNPERRTASAVDGVEAGSALWEDILFQEKTDGAFMLDFFGGKSFKFNDDYYIYINVGVSNILDKRDFITGGYEQLRFDFEEKDVDRFPSKYYFSYGLNYFMNVSFRF